MSLLHSNTLCFLEWAIEEFKKQEDDLFRIEIGEQSFCMVGLEDFKNSYALLQVVDQSEKIEINFIKKEIK